jgi:hypothetical protein
VVQLAHTEDEVYAIATVRGWLAPGP